MKRLIPLFLLFIVVNLLTACDNTAERFRARRGGFSENEKRNLSEEATFHKNLNVDSLDHILDNQFETFMTLIRKADATGLHKKSFQDFKNSYSPKALEQYLKIVYYFTGPIRSYKRYESSYDYDASSESISCLIDYKTTFTKCEGNTSLALISYDHTVALTDLVFHFNNIETIEPVNTSVANLFTTFNKKEYKKAYESASDNFKRLNYEDYFATLSEAIGQLSLAELEFTDGLIRVQEGTSNVYIELGFSRINYDGIIINFIVQPNGSLQLDYFEFVPA